MNLQLNTANSSSLLHPIYSTWMAGLSRIALNLLVLPVVVVVVSYTLSSALSRLTL